MSEKSGGVTIFFRRMIISLLMIVGAQALWPPQHVNAQGRAEAAKAENHRVVALQSNGFEPKKVNLTGECKGRIEYTSAAATGSEPIKFAPTEDVTIKFEGNKFSITPEGTPPEGSSPATKTGTLSVITRSSNNKHLSLSVNLTFDIPYPFPVFSLSLRGCYNRSNASCETPRKGPGTTNNNFSLKTVKGDLRQFSFQSTKDACATEPQISEP